jgi:TatD DNase family protein
LERLINIHTHHPTAAVGVLEIQSVRFGEIPEPDALYFSVGLHPWYLDGISRESALLWLREQAMRPEVLAVGEAGLDKLTGAAWDVQMQVFEWCIEVSEEVEKPLVVHCVRAYEEVLALKKRLKPKQPWMIHGFRKNLSVAKRLLDAGCVLSYGAALLQAQAALQEAFIDTPDDAFFLETDDQDVDIRQIYAAAAEIRQVSVERMARMMRENFQRVFVGR